MISNIIKCTGNSCGLKQGSCTNNDSGCDCKYIYELDEAFVINDNDYFVIGNETDTKKVSFATLKEVLNPTIPVTGITLDRHTTSIIEGRTTTLTATVLPSNATNKEVIWTSSDENIATVIDGTVTAIVPGTTLITATTVDGNHSDSCAVTVLTSHIDVTGVTLDRYTLTMYEDEDDQLVATVSPSNATNKAVIWSSSNPEVATVDGSGTVWGQKAGDTIITVTTVDGGHTANCSVRLNSRAIPVTGITLNKSTASLFVGETDQLIATVLPTNATNKNVSWSSNSNTVTVDQTGSIKGISNGGATIRATTVDGNYKADCAVTVTTPVKGYWGYNTTKGVIPTNGTEVKAMQNTVENVYKGKQFTMSIPADTYNIYFAYPASLGDVASWIYVELGNVEYKGALSRTTIKVDNVDYYMYYNSGTRPASSMTFKTTI